MLDFSGYKGELTVNNILKQVSDYQIISYYLGYSPKPGGYYLSPFRTEKRPSFVVIVKDRCIFKDHGNGYGGDCFVFVKMLYNLTFFQTLIKINQDLNLGLGNDFGVNQIKSVYLPPVCQDIINIEDKVVYKFDKRQFNKYDYEYWSSFGISRDTLFKFNVYSVSRVFHKRESYLYFVEDYKYRKDNPCYTYEFNSYFHKFYCPYSLSYKWFGNATGDIIQGYEQLPETGDLLIITSSLKDSMCLHDLGYTAVAPSSETANLTEDFIRDIRSRFNRILLYFDNDECGITRSEINKDKHGFDYVYNDIGDSKDVSDYYKLNGVDKTKELCIKLFNYGK